MTILVNHFLDYNIFKKIHIHIVHEGHKDHKCEFCGKSFTQSGYLRIHIRTIHEGKKDHKCESCSKSFSQAANLKQHIQRMHQGLKDQFYKCHSCEKSFSTSEQLKNHCNKFHENDELPVVKTEIIDDEIMLEPEVEIKEENIDIFEPCM